MKRIKKIVLILFIAAFTVSATQDAPPILCAFDQFGDTSCEDEMARLDNFTIQLQNQPSAKGVIIFYGGQRFRGRLPKRGEAAARASRLKPYLVKRRGIPADQIIVLDGGYSAEWQAQLWIVPAGAKMPAPYATIPAKDIKFGKGKATAHQFRCEI